MFDLDYLASVTENDRLLMAQLIDEFVHTMEIDVSEMKKAILQNDLKLVHQLAHRMKGSTSIVGAVKLQDMSTQLESMAHKNVEEDYYQRWKVLSEEFKQVVSGLRESSTLNK